MTDKKTKLENLSLEELEEVARKEGIKISVGLRNGINSIEDLKTYHGLDIRQEVAKLLAEMITKNRKKKQKMEANKRTKEYLEAVSDKVGEDEEDTSEDTVSKESGKD